MPVQREHCVICGRHWQFVGLLSRRGRCSECAERAKVESAQQMAARSGPYYDRWLASNATKEKAPA